jgi:antitoxin component YwqK of YwqJK toxin-antitoxin module
MGNIRLGCMMEDLIFIQNFNKGNGVTRKFHTNGSLSIEITYKKNNIIEKKCWDNQGNKIECK